MNISNSIKTTFPRLLHVQFPTILGVLFLVAGLIIGIFLVSAKGLTIFAPRATAETTPQNVVVSNVSESGFSVSFTTQQPTVSFVLFGTAENALRSRAADDRAQLSGQTSSSTTHHITVRSLEPQTTYYFVVGTENDSRFDNNGQPFSQQTAISTGTPPPAAKTVYGAVLAENKQAATGALVYVHTDTSGMLSSLVQESGTWAIPLANARTQTGEYLNLTDDTTLYVTVRGGAENTTADATTTVGNGQPVTTMTLGQSTQTTNTTLNSTSELNLLPSPTALAQDLSQAGSLATLLEKTTAAEITLPAPSAASRASTVVNLSQVATSLESPVVTTSQPTITGQAAPAVTVQLQIHSATEITQSVTADANGNFSLDLTTLSQQLEPGEHTVTYSYVDPATGGTVTKTQTFIVSDTSTQLALATQAPVPYGSGNPYPVASSTATASSTTTTATATQSSSASSAATTKGGIIMPATSSALPVSGSTQLTLLLSIGGIFFLLAGAWSYSLAISTQK